MYTGKADLLKTIHAKCMDCMCDQKEEVKLCPSKGCPLWPFRMGKDPYKTEKRLTHAQKDALAAGREKAATNRKTA